MTRAHQLPTQPASDEITLLTESRDALRRIITDPNATPNSIAKASSEIRHVLQRIAELETSAPKHPDTDPIEAIRIKLTTTPKTPRKNNTK